MKFIKTKLDGVYIVEPRVFADSRGWFLETYQSEIFESNGQSYAFVQDNHSYSAVKGTIRALHLQNPPYAQAKLVRCVRGAIFDVAADIRKDSPTYLQWVGVELSAQNHKMLMIPRGFAHGFVTLCDDTEVVYKVDNPYHKESEVGILYDDSDIGIEWGVKNPILSEKDRTAKRLKDCVIL
ncbi:MAG: dTDP-4-dehydrorhamnose 3,5-epimerase [Firmicutes bacterium]|nr:dTDP-4-dehydrorhamnose 3,5-epimerase [Bacillota bacterium]